MKYLIILLLAGTLAITSCTSKEKAIKNIEIEEATLGELQHGFELSEASKESFEEGLLLLHNFEYDDALTAFEEATAKDSTEVMAHWGEAMCHYKALWRLQNTAKGQSILSRLGDTSEERLASIKDPIKNALWQVVEIMYGPGAFDDRNILIKEHLASLHQVYPDNQEIAAFYALSLIWATEEYGDGSEDLRKAASVADNIIKVNPLHPGALHYKIHALDGPSSAKDAHAAADAYAKVAADASHALHMPSHIYLALGEWEGVVNSNQVSYDASVVRMNKLNLSDGARGYHSYAWWHYGLLQQGRLKEAEKILSDMLQYVPKDPTKGARGYLLGMQNRQLVAAGLLSEGLIPDTDVKVDDIGLTAKSMRSYLRAHLAYNQEDISTIKEEIKWLMTQNEMANGQISSDGLAMCAAGTSRYAPTENAIKSTEVVIAQLQGMAALIEKQPDRFETYMKNAVALEYDTNYPAGPPRITQPSFEQYGEWLLAQDRYADAIEQFDKSLERMPRRVKSLIGKMTALKSLNKTVEATTVHDELKDILTHADDTMLQLI